MLAVALWFIKTPLGRGVGIALILAIGIGIYTVQQRGIGADKIKDQIEQENDNAADAADAAALGFRDCTDADGMQWDFAAAECRRADEGDR